MMELSAHCWEESCLYYTVFAKSTLLPHKLDWGYSIICHFSSFSHHHYLLLSGCKKQRYRTEPLFENFLFTLYRDCINSYYNEFHKSQRMHWLLDNVKYFFLSSLNFSCVHHSRQNNITGLQNLSENTRPYYNDFKKKWRAFGSKTYLELQLLCRGMTGILRRKMITGGG